MDYARSERRFVPERREGGERREQRPRSASAVAGALTRALLSVDDWLESMRRAGQFNDVRGTQLLRHFATLTAAVEQLVQSLNAQ